MAYIEIPRTHYTPNELARMIGRSRRHVMQLIDEGKIPATRSAGGHFRIPVEFVKGVDHVQRIGDKA